jgi:hypothetical protein
MGIGTSRQREPENEPGNIHPEHEVSEQLNDEDHRLRRHLLNDEGTLSRNDNGRKLGKTKLGNLNLVQFHLGIRWECPRG